MKIHSESRIAHPREAVFAAYRDQLVEIANFLDDIEAIRVLARTEDGQTVRLHNEWISARDVPSFMAAFLKKEDLQWDDYATWHADSFVVEWEIKTRLFTESIRCVGRNEFIADGDVTRVVLSGDFDISNLKIPGVPGFLAKKILPKAEQFIVSLITPNLEKTNEAVGAFLDARG